MGKLVFRVASDWQEVVRLRTEIEKLKQTLLSMDSTQSPDTFKKLNVQLGESTKKMNILISDAAKAGATMENDFKKGIYDGEKAVNSLSEEIIKQKNIIRETQNDVSMLTEKYNKLGKYDPKRHSLSDELNRAKAALGEQKYALGELQSQQALARLSTKALKDEYALFKDESKAVITVNEGVGVSFKKALAAIGGIAMLKQVASNVVSTAGMFQKYESVLTNALNGSSEKAKAYLSDINSFAAKTNFQLDELTDDFIKFVNRGVTPSMDAMKKMGDFTNTVAKPFDQLTEAILDINNSERWKEFGVRVQTEGNKVKLSFRDMTVECDRTVESVMKAVEQFGSMKGVEGSTEAISKTIEGQMSNLEDTITTALAEIGLANQDLISGSLSAVDTIVKNYDIIGKSVLALIEIYGVYRAGLLINTIVEQGSVKSIWAKTTATKAVTVAQAAYNKVLAMNPYVAVGMAVVSLGIAMWTLADHTSEAEKAQKRFNKKQEEAAKQEQEHKQKIDSLVESSRDIALADLQRGQSLAELRKEYPKIFEKYDIETIKLADILKLKQQIAEEDAKRVGEKKAKEFSDIEEEIKYHENLLKSLSGQQGVDGYVKKLKQLRLDRDAILQYRGKGISEQFISNLKDVDISEFDRYISELEKRIKSKGENGTVKLRLPIDVQGTLSDEAIYNVKDIKTLIDTAKSAKQTRIDSEKNKTTYKEDLAKAKEKWEEAKKGYEAFLKDQQATSERVKKAREDMKLKEKAYKDLGGITGNVLTKQENQAEKLRKEQEKYALLMDKQALEQKRSAEDLQMKVDEARIKVMDEGSAKTIAEMELNFEKEMQAIDRQKEDALRKKIEDARTAWDANPENKGKSFDGSGITLSKDENTPFNELYKGGIAAFEKNLKEYQDKQDDAWNEYYIKYGEYQEKRKAIMDKYDKQIADAKEGSVEKSTFIAQRKEDLDSLDDELMKNSELWGRFFTDFSNRSSSSIRNIIEDIQELIDYMNGIEGTKIPDLFKDNEKTVKAINNAMANPSSLNKFTSSLSSQIAKFKKMLDKDNPFKQIQEGFKNNDFESTSKGFSGIASAVRELDGVLGDLGVKSDSTAGKVTSVLSSTASYAATGASIGGPWGAVIGGAIGMASGLIGVLGADYSAYNKMKEEYGALIDVWDMLISKKQKYIDISYGDEARKVGQEVLDLLNKKAQSNVALGVERLNAGASAGSHSIGVRQRKGMSSQGWDELRKAAQSIGFDYNSVADGRMTGLFSLTAEQLERLQEEAPTFWAKLDGDVQGYLQNIIDCSDEIEDMKTKLQETMTGVSFDSFYDSFVSTLSDMDKSSKDMADDFGEYLKNAILENLVANKYRSKIEALYKDWAAKSDSNGDGIFDLTTQESAELKKAQKALAEQIMAERDAMADAFGWDSSSTSQSSTSKGFEAMSQDTGEELNGRFTALQIAGEEVKNQNVIQSQSLNLLTAKADVILSVNTETRNIADDTRDLIAQSYLELVQISENTGAIVKPIQQMQRDIAEVKKNTAKL